MQSGGQQVLRLCDFLQRHDREIVTAWERALRAETASEAIPPGPSLRDHIPDLLARISAVVRTVHGGPPASLGDLPDRHALHRLARGYDLRTAAGELSVLRDVALQLWAPHVAGLPAEAVLEETRKFNRTVDEVMARSVDRYARARERTLMALDRVSSAALGNGGGVDRLLRRLLDVLLETTASADSGYMLLRDEGRDTYTIRAAAGTHAERSRGFTVRAGEGFVGEIVRTGEPLITHDAGNDPRVLNPALRGEQGVRALYGVPLVHGDEVVGVAKLASRSAYDFAEDDKHLLLVMAQRATALIVEARLAERERRARDSERRTERELTHLMEVSPEMLAVLGADGYMRRINPAFSVVLGYTHDELLTTPYPELVYAPDRERVREEVQAVLGGTPSRKLVFRMVRKDGAIRWVSFNASAEAGADSFVAVGRDVTEERERSEFEQQLIGIVSHDLRNPLHTIVMAASVLAQRGDLDRGALESVRRIHAAGERAVALIADLLDFTQARTAGGIAVKPQPVDLHALVREAAAEVHAMYPGRVLELEQHGRGVGTWDPARLGQVVENLLSNAFKYGAAAAPVVVRTLGMDGWVRLEVQNAGTPIHPDLLPHLFEPLRQGRRTGGIGAVAGVGLGLYIVDHVVRAHGGEIEVRSTAEDGTTFTVWLPRERPEASETDTSPHRERQLD